MVGFQMDYLPMPLRTHECRETDYRRSMEDITTILGMLFVLLIERNLLVYSVQGDAPQQALAGFGRSQIATGINCRYDK
jgi:hypothetical protein